MRVVLDTSVLFSALWQPLGNPAKVADAAIAGTPPAALGPGIEHLRERLR